MPLFAGDINDKLGVYRLFIRKSHVALCAQYNLTDRKIELLSKVFL